MYICTVQPIGVTDHTGSCGSISQSNSGIFTASSRSLPETGSGGSNAMASNVGVAAEKEDDQAGTREGERESGGEGESALTGGRTADEAGGGGRAGGRAGAATGLLCTPLPRSASSST